MCVCVRHRLLKCICFFVICRTVINIRGHRCLCRIYVQTYSMLAIRNGKRTRRDNGHETADEKGRRRGKKEYTYRCGCEIVDVVPYNRPFCFSFCVISFPNEQAYEVLGNILRLTAPFAWKSFGSWIGIRHTHTFDSLLFESSHNTIARVARTIYRCSSSSFSSAGFVCQQIGKRIIFWLAQ